jgi:hypothetical protein
MLEKVAPEVAPRILGPLQVNEAKAVAKLPPDFTSGGFRAISAQSPILARVVLVGMRSNLSLQKATVKWLKGEIRSRDRPLLGYDSRNIDEILGQGKSDTA